MSKKRINKIFKIIGILFLFFVLLFGVLAILIQHPKIQTYATNKILERLENNNSATISIDKVAIKFPKSLVLKGFYQSDQHQDTLIYAEKLTANFKVLKIRKRQAVIENVTLDGAVVNLKKLEDSKKFNFSFLIKENKEGIEVKDKKGKKPFLLNINEVTLQNTRFSYYDSEKIKIEPTHLKTFKVDVESLDIPQKEIHINKILIDNPKIAYEILAEMEKKEIELKELIPVSDWNIKVDNFELKEGSFVAKNKFLSDSNLPINVKNLQLDDINVQIKDIKYDSSLTLDIKKLEVKDNDNNRLKQLTGSFKVGQDAIFINQLKVELNNSSLSLTTELKINDFNNIIYSTQQNTQLSTNLNPRDVNLFLPIDKKISQSFSLSTSSSGDLEKLRLNSFRLQSSGLKLNANGTVRNVTKPKLAYLDLNILELNGSTNGVKQIAPWIELPEELDQLGDVKAKGKVNGKLNNITAELDLQSDIGNLNSTATINMEGEEMVFNGMISVPDINIQQLIPAAPVGKTDGQFAINGSGTNFETLEGEITGTLNNLELFDYTYSNLKFDGFISDKVFNGKISVDDKNVALDFEGMLDLSDSIPAINSHVNIQQVDLYKLGITKEPYAGFFAGNVQFTGDDINNLNGIFIIDSLFLQNETAEVRFDSTMFTFNTDEKGYKKYAIESNNMLANVEGDFDPLTLPRELERYLSHYVYYVNFSDTTAFQSQQIKGNIIVKEGFGLTEFFLGTVSMPENIEASFDFDNTDSIFAFNVKANTLGYKKYNTENFKLSAETKGNRLVASTGMDRVVIEKPNINIDFINFSTVTTKNSINGHLTVETDSSANNIDLKSSIKFHEDSINIHFADSYFKVNDMLWPFNIANELVIKEDAIIAKNFAIYNNDQYLKVTNASSDLSEIQIEFNQLNIPGLANIVDLDTVISGGRLSGQVSVKDPLDSVVANVDLIFNGVQVFDYYCDSINIEAQYDKNENKVKLAAVLDDPDYDVSAIGSYDLAKNVDSPWDLDIDVNRLYLGFLDKILKDEAHFDIHGVGKLQLKGSLTKPYLLGEAYVMDTAVISINFLGIDLIIAPDKGVKEKVIFTKNIMDFQSINVQDIYGNRAYMEGKLTHFAFKDMSVDARLFTDNFNVLNTTFNDNEAFFGKAFGGGSVAFSGLTRNINMDIDMKTNKNTKLSIPLASAGDTKNYNFKFINPFTDTSDVIEIEELIEIKGVNMDFDLEITPDAELELVLNTESQNNLRAVGEGNLNLRIDQNKQLSIYGTYNLIDGDYVFSPQNLLNKEFKIKNGSKIVWNGKPYEAALDVDAVHSVNARVDNILQDTSRATQNVPMDVIIKVGGTLNETDVSFDIEAQNLNIVVAIDEVQSFLDEIKNDQGEMTTQAISLLLVKRFLPSNSTVFTGASFSASEFGRTTALELVSNQVSNYLTDAISKLITEVELNFNIIQREDFSSETPGQTTTLQFDYEQKLLQNRLILNIGGNFEFVDDNSNQENTIAGDFEVEGLLTEDGRLRGKAFHRTADYDIFNQDRSRTGVSLSYTKDFDTIDEIFKPDANKKKRRQLNRDLRKDKREERKRKKQNK